jgi:ATP phosphoribosyltransferase regulatory subunit
VFLPSGTPESEAQRLRGEGWISVMGLDDTAQPAAEAKRMRCSHVLKAGAPVPVD